MMRQVTSVNWAYIGDALPAFVTIVSMPFTYSVAYGLIAGLFTYTVLNGLIYITKKISCGRIEPPDADNAEYWTILPRGGNPPWFIRAAQGKLWRGGKDGVMEIESVSGSTMRSERELEETKGRKMRVQDVGR